MAPPTNAEQIRQRQIARRRATVTEEPAAPEQRASDPSPPETDDDEHEQSGSVEGESDETQASRLDEQPPVEQPSGGETMRLG